MKNIQQKYELFLKLCYSYPLIIDVEECMQFQELIVGIFIFYEKNITYLSSIGFSLEKKAIYKEIYNDIKHKRKKVQTDSFSVFEYDDTKKLFKFIKNSIKAEYSCNNKKYRCNDIESDIQKIVSEIQSKLNINYKKSQTCCLQQSYYPFVYQYYHLTETPLLVENPVRNISFSFIKPDGSIINIEEIDYCYSVYQINSNGNIITTIQERSIPYVLAEYCTDKVITIWIKNKSARITLNNDSITFKDSFDPLINQKFLIAVNDSDDSEVHLLYEYKNPLVKSKTLKILQLNTKNYN